MVRDLLVVLACVVLVFITVAVYGCAPSEFKPIENPKTPIENLLDKVGL